MAAGVAPNSVGRRELRIAPVMTGGTSLSVWMGGVTAELYCLLAAGTRHQTAASESNEPRTVDMYRQMLALADLEPRIDVVTGTSAGGLNGTLISAAWRCWVPPHKFLELRETWLGLADLNKLLRKPTEVDPPSLLKGDQYFRAEIEEVLSQWRKDGTRWKHDAVRAANAADPSITDIEHPLDLLITVTTVDPEARRRRDDYGETISDVNHAHRLRFDHTHIRVDGPDPIDETWPTKLAIASRTSACIPGVFEPSFLPVTDGDATASGLPNFEQHASFSRSHFAVDGGVVVNLPLNEALERVFFQSADAPVRRVVLFVQPTPSTKEQPPAKFAAPPTIRESLTTVVSAPRAEGIIADVDQIRSHNRAVGRQAESRRSLHTVIGRGSDGGNDVVAAANAVMAAYGERRAESSVQFTADSVARAVAGALVDRDDVARALRGPRLAIVPTDVNRIDTAGSNALWAWGIAPVEHAVSMVLDLVRSAPHALLGELRTEWRALDAVVRRLRRIRELDREHWSKELAGFPKDALGTAVGPDGVRINEAARGWAEQAYRRWPSSAADSAQAAEVGDLTGDARNQRIRAHYLTELHELFDDVAGQLHSIATTLRATLFRLSDELRSDLDVLAPPEATVPQLAVRLRALHVLQTMLLGDIVAKEQKVELQIISWNATDHLTGRQHDAKLAGPELARLGAFLKRSWRANDFCWGRLDGASRLTELILERGRLREVLRYPDKDARIKAFVESTCFEFTTAERADVASLLNRVAMDPPRREIYPDDAAYAWAVDQYEHAHRRLVALVAPRLQREIARTELPHVADAVRHSIRVEKANDLNGVDFLRAYEGLDGDSNDWTDDDVDHLLGQMRVGEEDVASELGYGLLNRTISRGSAVAANALASDRAGISVVSKVVAPLRTPLHTVNSIVATATSPSPLYRFVSLLAFAVGGALVGLRIAGVEVNTPLVVAAEILLLGALFAALFRSGFWRLLPALLVGGTVIGLAIVGDDLSDVVYSEAKKQTVEIDEGAVVTFGANGRIEVTGPTDADGTTRTYGLDAELTVRAHGAELEVPEQGDFVAPWKDSLFLERDELGWILFATSAFATLFSVWYVTKWRSSITGLAASTRWVGGVVVLLGLTLFFLPSFGLFRSVANEVLTGHPLETGTNVKDVVVQAAGTMGSYRIEIVVLVMLVASIMLAGAFDLVVRRWAIRGWSKIRRRGT